MDTSGRKLGHRGRLLAATLAIVSPGCDPVTTFLSGVYGAAESGASAMGKAKAERVLKPCLQASPFPAAVPGEYFVRYGRASGSLKECLDSKVIHTCDPDTGTVRPSPAGPHSACAISTGTPVQQGDAAYFNLPSSYAKATPGGANVAEYVLGGATGTVMEGPVTSGGQDWVRMDFEVGGDGWIPSSRLKRVSESAEDSAGDLRPKPGMNFIVEPLRVPPGGTVTLTWSSTNATWCKSSWGDIGLNGKIESPPLQKKTRFFVYCGDGATHSVTREYVVDMG
jgi:hypothetical protein